LNLPASPSIGDTVAVRSLNNTNTITIGANGNNIESQSADMVLNVTSVGLSFVYSNATVGWAIANNIASVTFSIMGQAMALNA
jgi:hypothetical protein